MNETTRERLIRAARRIFAERGYDAASVREITAAAAANLGAVNYHFGSKQALYDAVLDSVLDPLERRLEPETAGDGAGAESAARNDVPALVRIDGIVAALFEHLAANPDFQLLVLQQAVTRRALPAPLQRRLGGLVARLAEAVRAGQAAGSIGPGDPMLTAISLLAQPMYFGLVSRLAPDRLKADGGSTPTAAAISAHARRFIRVGLAGGTEGTDG